MAGTSVLQPLTLPPSPGRPRSQCVRGGDWGAAAAGFLCQEEGGQRVGSPWGP